ncbi:MAG: UDP-N-acetylmuramate dehydrogenase [Candidatus Aminicenantes bacterium]|nr:UDP-N-acetylmuramate dehydrogenase [Candidatus Aminicenantes bacterium]
MQKKASDFQVLFQNRVGARLRKNVPLHQYSNFRIGGKADYFFLATSSKQLADAVILAEKLAVPYRIIGGGFNVLFDDDGYRGLIIKNDAKGIEKLSSNEIRVLSGTDLKHLVCFCIEEGLGRIEFLAGIPGTVGGAVCGNAGAFGKSVGDIFKSAEILKTNGQKVEIGVHDMGFRYRWSLLKEAPFVLLKAVLALEKENPESIKNKVESNIKKRENKHPPWSAACAGSYFKNPPSEKGDKIAAGFLLDKVGARSLKRGDAAVYKGHSNFLINTGRASSKDVRALASELKQRVKKRFGIALEEEVVFIPADPASG